jgi:hypothetical protein
MNPVAKAMKFAVMKSFEESDKQSKLLRVTYFSYDPSATDEITTGATLNVCAIDHAMPARQ